MIPQLRREVLHSALGDVFALGGFKPSRRRMAAGIAQVPNLCMAPRLQAVGVNKNVLRFEIQVHVAFIVHRLDALQDLHKQLPSDFTGQSWLTGEYALCISVQVVKQRPPLSVLNQNVHMCMFTPHLHIVEVDEALALKLLHHIDLILYVPLRIVFPDGFPLHNHGAALVAKNLAPVECAICPTTNLLQLAELLCPLLRQGLFLCRRQPVIGVIRGAIRGGRPARRVNHFDVRSALRRAAVDLWLGVNHAGSGPLASSRRVPLASSRQALRMRRGALLVEQLLKEC
mmetsp:Transcript_118446/g.346934  ORF Transcript_118446/g.346934 Transcript_118446/m.346934 type:complete len:286 (-) Transcript_118446:229-1086(-)